MKVADIVLQHPKLHLITDRVKGAINLAMEKVVAHEQNPQQYPLPSDSKSLERALHNLFSKMPNRKQKKMIEKASVVMKKSAAQRAQIYGDLVAVNLKSSVSIVQQVKAIPPPANFKLTEAEINNLKSSIGAAAVKPTKATKPKTAAKAPGRTPAAPAATVLAAELKFFIDSLTCNKKDEITKDEINLAGVSVDSAGGVVELAPFFVGKFKKGQTIAVGQNPFNFKLTDVQFPATFSAGLFIIETDLLHNPDTVRALIIVFMAAAIALNTISLAMVIVGLAGGPASLALIIATFVAGVVAGVIGQFVVPLLADDISNITLDSLTFDAPVEPGKQFDRTIAIEGVFLGLTDSFGGKYQAAVHWLTE
jgi:hypothetical protein